MRPEIRVLSTGGTIASTSDEDGAAPSKSGVELVEAVPALADYAELAVTEVTQIPSFDMDPATVAELGRAAREAVADGADGVVVTHGTDTMEESAYYLDLALDLDAPIVFTGAQRRPDEVSSDGPANLLTAVRAASHDDFEGQGGVYVAFDEEVHAARDVVKAHTSKLGTFESPGKGPVAVVSHEGMRQFRAPGSRTSQFSTLEATTDVRMVKTGSGVDGTQIEHALADDVDGIVLEGTGLGNTTAALGDAVADVIAAGIAVVVTSRCFAGSTAPVYGTGGGGETLRQHGVMFGDDLPAHKARLKLMLALEEASDREAVRELFAR